MPQRRWGRRIWENKWVGLAAAVYAEACGGLAYTFSIYSDHVKDRLGYTQTQIDGLSSMKDFGGNTGVISGLMYNLMPPWASVLIGGAVNLVGYMVLFLTASQAISVPYWLVCVFITIGANGETWIGTAVLVTSMQTFPNERGVVVGLLKSYIGLSGAMFTRVYKSFFEPHANAYILMQAWGPFLVSLLVMSFIRPYPVSRDNEAADVARRFRWSYYIVAILASYLMVTIVLEELVQLGRPAAAALTVIMLLILLLPGLIPFAGALSTHSKVASEEGRDQPAVDKEARGLDKEGRSIERQPSLHEEEVELLTNAPPVVKLSPTLPEFTLTESLQSLDYWLLFVAVGAGTGCGLTIINNLAQMGRALGSHSVSSFVALISIWNCAGRLIAGYGSEWCVAAGQPRTLVLVLAIGIMGLTQLLLATGSVVMLFVGSILVGLSYGAHWTLTPAITSEMFGLRHFGAIYNTVTICSPLTAYFLSTWVAGFLYDLEVARQRKEGDKAPALDSTCLGPECFRTTLLILAAVCGCGVACALVLVSRTRALYAGRVETLVTEVDQEKVQ